MSIFRRLRLLHLCYLSRPSADRRLYRAIRRHRPRKIVELGVGDARRALRMIEIAQQSCLPQDIHYVGMDLFEGRDGSGGRSISLKAAHQLLRATGVRVQLVPGNPPDALIRLANSLGKVDLLIVPAELQSAEHARTWFFVPRFLHERSLVFVEGVRSDGRKTLQVKPRAEIDQIATAATIRRRAA